MERIKKLFLYFMVYSVIGWLYEVFLEVAVYRWGFTNRGVLFGPYCPVYGVGALLFLFTVYPLIKNANAKRKLLLLPAVIVMCALTATALELATSYILELLTGSWPWQTYADYRLNFQARIALSPSVRFGLGGAAFLYIVQPVLERLAAKMSPRALNAVTLLLGALFAADLAAHIVMIIIH